MFELIRNIIFAITGIFALYWFMSELGGWQELAEKYKTENSLPKTFLVTENQRISFSNENKSGSAAFTNLGIGVCDYGLYLSNSSFPDPFMRFPALLIPWSDIAYRRAPSTNSLEGYYTFYLGKPRMVRFSLNGDTVNHEWLDFLSMEIL